LKQLKYAGFQASSFKSDGCSVAQLRQVGFTARELLHSSAQELEDLQNLNITKKFRDSC
jgi:hypothetical protein